MGSMKVQIRRDLISNSIGDELIVFDPRTNQAHHLNETASSVFASCRAGIPPAPTSENGYALRLLEEKGLFEPGRGPGRTTTRREALAMVGKAALLPAVASVFIPAASAAASAGVFEADCDNGVAGSCGQVCKPNPGEPDFGEIRVCGSFVVNGPCGCIPQAASPVCPCT